MHFLPHYQIDSKMDFDGKQMATCSSDGMITIHEFSKNGIDKKQKTIFPA
jgi:hypothetical protein